MPSLSERIALRESTGDSTDSTVEPPTCQSCTTDTDRAQCNLRHPLPIHSPIVHVVDGIVRCGRQDCGRAYGDSIHLVLSPFARRALAGTLPAKVLR